MDFYLTPELIEMKKSIKDFIVNTVDPLADQIEREDHIPENNFESYLYFIMLR